MAANPRPSLEDCRDFELRRAVEREAARVVVRRALALEDDERRDRDFELGRAPAERVDRDRLVLRFFPPARCDLVSPFSRRILFTVRAATSSARPP
jgi:hypothetical protein